MTTAAKHGAREDIGLLTRLMEQESRFDQNARSRSGALGLMQLMPGTAKELGVDPTDWQQNIDGGVRRWVRMKSRFNNVGLAAAAYNAGAQNVRSGKASSFPETRNYVQIVTGRPLREWEQEGKVMDMADEAAAWLPQHRNTLQTQPDPFRDFVRERQREALASGAATFPRVIPNQFRSR